MFYEFSDPDKHALTQTMLQSSGQVNRLRWMIKAQQLQVGQEQASNLIKEVSDKTKSCCSKQQAFREDVHDLHAVEGLLLGEGVQHATFATQARVVRPAHQHLSDPNKHAPTQSYPSERTAAQNDEAFREETCTLWKVSCSATAFNTQHLPQARVAGLLTSIFRS